MKRAFITALPFLLALVSFSQDIQYKTKTINIEVPVRVFKGDAFVGSLTLDDFEIYDNGRLQKLEAVYLIKKTSVEPKGETRKFAPQTARHFYLLFEIGEFNPKIPEAVDFFVKNVLVPGDDLTITTPMKTYRMKKEALQNADREKICKIIIGLVRRDTLIGNSEYRGILEELKSLAKFMASEIKKDLSAKDAFFSNSVVVSGVSIEEQLQQYSQLLQRLEGLRVVDQRKLLDFAQYLNGVDGPKNVFLFYEREFIPKLDPTVLSMYNFANSDRPDIQVTLSGLFDLYRRETPLNVDYVKQAFSSSSTAVHFLFISKPAERSSGIVMEEQSEDIYAAFTEMAKATGGISDASANIAALMKSAVGATENYYLLYYTPADYQADGKFHYIQVKTKSGSYRLVHRSGYIAD
jgi:hypothetical protein